MLLLRIGDPENGIQLLIARGRRLGGRLQDQLYILLRDFPVQEGPDGLPVQKGLNDFIHRIFLLFLFWLFQIGIFSYFLTRFPSQNFPPQSGMVENQGTAGFPGFPLKGVFPLSGWRIFQAAVNLEKF